MNDIKRLFNNPDPRIRQLTEALLRIRPVEKAKPADLRRRLNDAAEAAQLKREAALKPVEDGLERVGIDELLNS